MRRDLYLSTLILPLALAACLDPDPIPESNYGVVGLTTVVRDTDTLLSPAAQFYRTGLLGLPTSRVATDQCQIAPYPNQGQTGPLPRFLDAGDSVAVSTVTTTKYLFPAVGLSGETYALDPAEQFGFHPGENIMVTVPGAPGGFANGTISVLSAHGFTLGPIDPSPPASEPMPLTWTPAGDDSTKLLVSLQYGVNQITADEQVFCSLRDDGAADIPADYLRRWRTAMAGSRAFEAARWRIAAKEVTGGVLLAISVFQIEGTVD